MWPLLEKLIINCNICLSNSAHTIHFDSHPNLFIHINNKYKNLQIEIL